MVTLDLLGHGRSDRPADPVVYSVSAFADQVVALLDHLGAEKAVVGGLSLGANVALELAATCPDRVQGLIIEMPVLDNALDAAILASVPVMLAARYLPWTVSSLRAVTRPVPRGLVPFWAGVWLDTLDQLPASVAALIHGVIFGRVAPPSPQRRTITARALVVGHPKDPIHPFADAAMLAEELPYAEFVETQSLLEWRARPERLNAVAAEFARSCWTESPAAARRRTGGRSGRAGRAPA